MEFIFRYNDFSFKFIFYCFIILHVRHIYLYPVTTLSKISMINDEKYFNHEHLNGSLDNIFTQTKNNYNLNNQKLY